MLVGPGWPVSAAGLYHENSQSPYDGPTTGPVFMVRPPLPSFLLPFLVYRAAPCSSLPCRLAEALLSGSALLARRRDRPAAARRCLPSRVRQLLPPPAAIAACAVTLRCPVPLQAAKMSVLTDLGEGISVPAFASQVG